MSDRPQDKQANLRNLYEQLACKERTKITIAPEEKTRIQQQIDELKQEIAKLEAEGERTGTDKVIPYFYPPELGTTTFVGRKDELHQLHQLLQPSNASKTAPVAIAAAAGMGGVGKTELAWQYIQQHRDEYAGGIWWLSASFAVSQIVSHAQRMGLPEPGRILATEAELVKWYYDRWLEALPDGMRLLVFDDVVEYKAIKGILPSDGRFRVLLTTRMKWEEEENIRRLELETLTPLAAYELFDKTLQLRSPDVVDARMVEEQATAEQLCKWVGYLPLGIKLIACFLRVEPDLSLEEMLARLEAERLANEALTRVEVAFQLSWGQLSVAEQQLAGMLGVFAVAPIQWGWVEKAVQHCQMQPPKRGWFKRLFGKPPKPQQWCLLLEARGLEQARRRLVELSLLVREEKGKYVLHVLMREFFAAKLETELQEVAEGLRRAVARVIVEETKAKMSEAVTLEVIAELEEFLLHMAVVAESLTPLLEDSTDTIIPFVGLARVAAAQSRWQDAERWYRRCLEMTEHRFGVEHLSSALSLGNLASCYYAMGRYQEAESLWMQALAIKERKLSANHLDLGTILNNLAELYKAMGRYSEAEPLYLRSLSISEQQLGADHPNTASSLCNLAGLYNSMGRYSDAETLCLRSLYIRENKLGINHISTAKTRNNLALLYHKMGRYQEAEPLLVQALSVNEQYMGFEHPDTATSLNNLAMLYNSMGRYSETEVLFLRSLSIKEMQLGTSHPRITNSLNNLAELYRAMGRYSEAEPLYLRALSIKEHKLGVNHPETAISLNNLAQLYNSMQRYSEAEPLYLRSLSIREQHLGIDHPSTADSLNNLGTLYYAMGRYSEAESLYLRSLSIKEQQLSKNHPEIATSLNNLAMLYKSIGRYSEAEPLYLRTLEIWTQSLGETHPNTQTAWRNFRYLVQQAVQARRAAELSDHPATQAILQEMRAEEFF
jgi:tetratricopeptide (TPR) repeat protein